MNKLLQFSTYGIKNIEKLISIDFANQTIEKGINKINNVKGIFGYNGSGKSALISSMDYYTKLVCVPNFLMQNEIKLSLDKLINYVKKEFYISVLFEFEKNIAIKHSIKLSKDLIVDDYVIKEESVELSNSRTLNGKFKNIIEKKDNKIIYADIFKENERLEINQDLRYNSIVQILLQKILEKKVNKIDQTELTLLDKIVVKLYSCVNNIDVYLQESDLHRGYKFGQKSIEDILLKLENNKQNKLGDIYLNDVIIRKEDYDFYVKENKKLERFIKYFKPELKSIELIPLQDAKLYHLRKVFVYNDYKVELEFESSGIKQLIKLFSYLEKCANGKIVFIDEIDTNINAVYFSYLISFFKKYGKGQLIFTTHNIEAMKSLKSQSKSILALGVNNKIDTWVGKGNKSPISDYINGEFPNSPMNIEDFDFINIFLGEE